MENSVIKLASANSNQKGIFSLSGFLITRITVGKDPMECAINPIERLINGMSVEIQIKILIIKRTVEIISFLPQKRSPLNIIDPKNINNDPKRVTHARTKVEVSFSSLITLARLLRAMQRKTVRVNKFGRYTPHKIA